MTTNKEVIKKLTLGLKIILTYAVLKWVLYLFFALTIPTDIFVIIYLTLPLFMVYGIYKLKKWGLYLGVVYYFYEIVDVLHFLLFSIIEMGEILFQGVFGVMVPIIIVFYLYKKRNIFS